MKRSGEGRTPVGLCDCLRDGCLEITFYDGVVEISFFLLSRLGWPQVDWLIVNFHGQSGCDVVVWLENCDEAILI